MLPSVIHTIGDSITQGVGTDTGAADGYRLGLLASLTGAGQVPRFVGSLSGGADLPVWAKSHSGYGGQNCSQIQRLWSRDWGLSLSAWIFLLQAGTNDVRTDLGINPNVNTDWDALFDAVLAQANKAALVVAAIPTPLADSGNDGRIVTLGAHITFQVALRASQGHRCVMVDMHGALTTGDLSDGIHPTVGGYAKMAAVWFAAIQAHG